MCQPNDGTPTIKVRGAVRGMFSGETELDSAAIVGHFPGTVSR